jgi:gamma-glutamylcyclotransferase (GGCT)/AIG2-like uncharacterized protein YtfP
LTEHLFVYGTLSPQHAPPEISAVAQKLRPVGSASIRGQLYDLGEYPGAVLSSRSGSVIRGEVFELPDDRDALSYLDEYEGFEPARPRSSLFVRRNRSVRLDDGTQLRCWVYVYNRPVKGARLLTTGRFTAPRQSGRRTSASK